ncbi:hypothetical protein GP486_001324 [Trichoglossum hirsutum]|uniref:Importin N-terminal domain-containing protein n=1 Tax=Trichoglossum hirsutum TaxID=265104 RepID=A0A9P8RSQ6_9PEZI|nr:hypothetical protein GP486_001324 [Trichoglossum hirsutum]
MDQQQFVRLLENVLTRAYSGYSRPPQTSFSFSFHANIKSSCFLADTERVKSATANLRKNYFTSPLTLTLLLQVLTTHESPQLRQLAAVEARALVPKHWNSLPAEQKPQIRNSLLQSTLNEQTALVRHSSARVISAIAKIDLLDGEWADLPSFLQQAATSQSAGQREVGVYILYTLLETLEDGLMGKLSDMFALFGQTIRDPESVDVRINTLLALGRIATIMIPDEDPQSLEAFRTTFPNMVAVLKEVIQSGDDDRTMLAFEVFQTLLGCESSLLANHFQDLILFMIELGASRELSDETRSQSLSFLMQSVRYRKLKIQGLRLGEKLTLTALEVATEMKNLHEDDDLVTPSRTALGLLDMLAAGLPPSQVIVPLLKALPMYVNSPNPDYRRAGILALGMCVEGAPDFIATQMKDITPIVLRLLGDPEIRVRQAALHAVARLADDLADALGEEHEALVPALLKNLDSASVPSSNKAEEEWNLDIIKASCNAIDSFTEGIGKEQAASYLSEMVPRFSRLIAHPDYKVKAGAAGALGSIAAAAEDAFLPYFEATISALSQYVSIKDSEEELDLRSAVCDAMGSIASAVGAVPFQPYVRPMMEASEEALHLGHPRLRETSYILWSTMAKVYEAEFGHFLDGVVKGLFESLQQEETALEVELGEEAKDLLGAELTIAGKKIKVAAAGEGISQAKLKDHQSPQGDKERDDDDDGDDDNDEDDDDDDDDDDDAWDELGAVTAVAAEKEIALDVIGDVLSHTKSKFIPYFEKTVEITLGLVEHSYEGVRKAAIGTLWRAYACLWEICEDGQMAKWQPGLPLKVQPTAELQKLGEVVMTATLAVYVNEVDRGTVTDINRNIAATLKLCGPAILTHGDAVHEITTCILSILRKQHPCQQDMGDLEEVESMQESSEYDWMVVDTAMDVITGLAAALGTAFGELWKIFEKPILRYAGSSEALERSTSVGTIAECIQNMGDAVTPFTPSLMKMLLHRLSDEDPETKSNAAFAMGQLCDKSRDANGIVSNYNTILQKLEPLLHAQSHRLLDNAAGCVARMITAHPENIPIDDVLPLLVDLLPLKEDFEENKPIYEMLVKLYESSHQTVRRLTPQLIPVFAKVLGPPQEQLADETRGQLAELVKYIHKQEPSLVVGSEVLMQVVGS